MEKRNDGHLKKEIRVNVTREERDAFKEYCKSLGKSTTEILKEFVLQCIGEHMN